MDQTIAVDESIVQIGEMWIAALARADYSSLSTLLDPQAHVRLITPKRFLEMDDPDRMAETIRGWFDGDTIMRTERSRVQLVGERLSVSYRFLVAGNGQHSEIEQQIYATLEQGKITRLELLCSGFQPISGPPPDPQPTGTGADALLVFEPQTGAVGSTCAVLTPSIRYKLSELGSGQVLEVRVPEAAADASIRGDVEAWCRLSGNELLDFKDAAGEGVQFWVRKK